MDERSDFFSQGMPCPSFTLEFQQCLHDLKFMDMHHDGPIFTLTNKRSLGFVAKMLDRFPANSSWLHQFPDLRVEFSPPEFSDHCARWLKFSNA